MITSVDTWNSVGRFISWGAVPIGGVLGGVLVSLLELGVDRERALRAPYLIQGVLFLVIHVWTRRRLTPAAIDEARDSARATPVDVSPR